jgi:hypothetical protein
MSHNVFRRAAEQDVFEPRCAVRGSYNQVHMVLDRSRANLLAGMSDLQ